MEADNSESMNERRANDSHDDNCQQRDSHVNSDIRGVAGSKADRTTIEIEVEIEDDVLTTVERLEDAVGAESIRAVDTRPNRGAGQELETAMLTEKQNRTLRAAYDYGYFEQPRHHSATEIAESLGVSHSTFLRHLRAAQQHIFDDRFD
jgi:predicted DNA binding protein